MGDIQQYPVPNSQTADLRTVGLADLAGGRSAEADAAVRRILRSREPRPAVVVAAFNSSI